MRSLAVLEDDGAALAVGDEVRPGRRGDDAEFLGDDVTVEIAALMAAVLLRPGHADPALGADALGELAVEAVAPEAGGRVDRAALDLLGEEGADFAAQDLGLGRQAERIEADGGLHFGHVLLLYSRLQPDLADALSG